MSHIFQISPPNLIPWLSREEKECQVTLLDLEIDILDRHSIRLDLNVVFNPLSVKRGKLKKVDFYVGSTGGEITVEILDGTIKKFTDNQTLDVNYSNTITRKRISSLKLNPKVTAKKSSSDLNLNAGSIAFDANEERTFSAAFSASERSLASILMGNTLKWVIALPRGEKVIRDFLLGNLYLFAECCWYKDNKSGCIKIRPSDVRFFDADRRPLGSMASLMMQYVLWKKNIKILSSDGFEINFKNII